MPLAVLVVVVVLAHTAYNGCRLTLSLNALALGASPLTVGVLMSLIAALPMLFGVASGRLVDRIGVRRPLLIGAALLTLAVALPGVLPGLASMPVAAALAGSSFALVHICAQHMVGEMSAPERRRDNFGWLALGFATSNFVGPTVAGFAIDAIGHRGAFLLLALFALAAFAVLAWRRSELTHTPHGERRSGKRSAFELLRSPDLRRVFLVSGMLAAAWHGRAVPEGVTARNWRPHPPMHGFGYFA